MSPRHPFPLEDEVLEVGRRGEGDVRVDGRVGRVCEGAGYEGVIMSALSLFRHPRPREALRRPAQRAASEASNYLTEASFTAWSNVVQTFSPFVPFITFLYR